ncbi:hypothetical protein [Flavobacterium humi]|uniref:Uncharacterized protein n=1 Tax=Flavobacterium humi TaxID=2562683 RepID=A0A4Z0LDC2_9FLAO|nr:hypothetical protein [Flavobacterium humi]TGD59877.1 hypothetical protein E4635_02805 [Flavobacterium humi]
MNSSGTQDNLHWFSKLSLCFLAIVGAANTALFIIAPLLPFALAPLIIPAGLSTLAIAILFSVGFSIYWHNKEKKGKANAVLYISWLTTLLRYWIAFLLFDFGYQKLFEVNFNYSYHINDTLVSQLNGQELTWVYYGYSYNLAVILALFQIIGSFLLLFRRSVLAGVAVLLPVIANIVLINMFYHIGPITLFTSVQIALGLTYLLWQHKTAIISFFKECKDMLPTIGSNMARPVARLACILLPCLFVYYYNHNVHLSKKYFGKWKVEAMTRNGKPVAENEWQKDSLAWKTIYIEERGKMYYCPNPYMYVDSTSIFMKYDYDDARNTLKVISYEKNPQRPDTIPVTVTRFQEKSMQWDMVFDKNAVHMALRKVE